MPEVKFICIFVRIIKGNFVLIGKKGEAITYFSDGSIHHHLIHHLVIFIFLPYYREGPSTKVLGKFSHRSTSFLGGGFQRVAFRFPFQLFQNIRLIIFSTASRKIGWFPFSVHIGTPLGNKHTPIRDMSRMRVGQGIWVLRQGILGHLRSLWGTFKILFHFGTGDVSLHPPFMCAC